MKEIEAGLNGLLLQIVDSKGQGVPDGTTYKDISKVSCEGYASQELVTIKVFLYSKGSISNNKPYTIPELVPEGLFYEIRKDLREILTDTSYGKFKYKKEPKEEEEVF